ncbi:MAG: C40 family peptidase [Oscillospiraceae bacterium]|nr:C40 family peptidase [Oscillospiraceae bacterium]MBR6862574.1 C40 family peptidase [Acidaminococcaceae bacterium]
MDVHHNRGSPRLQFTKEELESDTLSRPIVRAEKAADRHNEARKKLKRKQLRLIREEPDTLPESGRKTAGDVPRADTESMFFASEPVEETEQAAGVQTDPRAPGVRNTRQRPDPGKADGAERASGPMQTAGKSKAEPGVSGNRAVPVVSMETDKPGRKKTLRLKFEETQAKKPSLLTHSVERTIRTAGDQLHRQAVQSNEDENVALEAVLKADDVQESVLQAGEHAYHTHQIRHVRQAEKAERKLDKTGIDFLQSKHQQEHPQFTSNPLSRWQQKHAIRKEYAAAKRGRGTAQKTAKAADKAVEKTGEAAGKAAAAAGRHPTVLVVLALIAMLLFLISALQSCSPLMQAVLESIAIGTYPAEEADVKAAERAYLEKERALKDEMNHYERYHPGYDEYHVEADEIWHDPYVLIAIISAYCDGEEWNIDSAMPVISRYFSLQYEVTETIQTRTWVDNTGKLQSKTVCNVTLKNRDLSHLPAVYMDHRNLSMYALYMSTHGNMDGIFQGSHAAPLESPLLYEIPKATLDADPVFAKLMEEASKYVGYPYVWGGSDPETSFDCSGFVSYVFTNSGVYNTGRLGTKGLRSLCQNVSRENVRPGDIVFFEGTLGDDVSGVTHCGIYVGNNMMIHCGNPIGYANLNDSYWRRHFHSYGRVPN